MELDQKCQEVMEGRGWSQRQLAEALGITDKNLISMRRGRRPMPAHALIRLERLRGTDDHSIIEQLLKTAACVALAVVLLLLPARENVAYASEAYAASIDNNTNYGVFTHHSFDVSDVIRRIKRNASAPPDSAER